MGRSRMVTCWMTMLLLVLCSDIILCRRGSSSKKANQSKSPPPVNKPTPPTKKEPVKTPGTLCYTGQLLAIKLEPEDDKYYTDNFKKFPDCIYYPKYFQSLEPNATTDTSRSECFNFTVSQSENKLDLSEGKNATSVYTRVMWQVISHLCAMEFCYHACNIALSIHGSFGWLAMLCLLSFISLTLVP